MKRIGGLFEKAFTRENLLQAFHDASKHKKNRRGCFEFERCLGSNIDLLHRELHAATYKPNRYYTFTIYEPKQRQIYAPAFRDCVIQHAIYRILTPIFETVFIDQSFACRKGLGTHKAADYAQQCLQSIPSNSYTLKMDIRKFFYRIDRNILQSLLEKKIKDKRMVKVMMMFTDYGEDLGIPIGNLLSQLFALIYLNPVDHYIKRQLKIKLYCRYVDDFILFGLTKSYAIECMNKVIKFIHDNLKLELSKSTLAKASKGVNFVGYRTWSRKRFIRRRSLYNFRQTAKQGKVESVISILGHARQTHTLKYLLTTLRDKYHAINIQLPKIYHPRCNAYTQVTR